MVRNLQLQSSPQTARRNQAWASRLKIASIAAALFSVTLGTASNSVATEYDYSGAFGGGWGNRRAWSPFGFPAAGDIANVNVDKDVNLRGDTNSISELRMSNGARLSTNGSRLSVKMDAGQSIFQEIGPSWMSTRTQRDAGLILWTQFR